MAKVIQQSKTNKNLLYAITITIKTNGIKSAVHDGDTVNVNFDGHFGIRFLGGDTAEVALTLPGSGTEFPTPIKNPAWKPFLIDPFASEYGIFSRFELDGITKVEGDAESILGRNLIEYLRPKLGMRCTENHSFHAEQAHRHLEDLIKVDVEECIQQQREYHFFLAFSAYSLTDRYGRLLAFVNRQDISTEDRKLSDNERMIRDGYSAPYFIWPNIDPFRSQHNRRAAVPLPNELQEWLITGDGKILQETRQAVREARQAGKGIFSDDAPGRLSLFPFELRYLAGRRAPDRYIIDLSRAGTPMAKNILEPREYHQITNSEDRLFIDADDLSLFLKRGYIIDNS